MKLLACIVTATFAVAPAACGDNQAALTIVSPGSGSFIPTTAPLDLHMSGNGFEQATALVAIDGSNVAGITSTLGSACEPCEFDVTVPISGFEPTHHTVKVEVDEGETVTGDQSELAEATISYDFESPGAGSN
jgi:hypothetical protein